MVSGNQVTWEAKKHIRIQLHGVVLHIKQPYHPSFQVYLLQVYVGVIVFLMAYLVYLLMGWVGLYVVWMLVHEWEKR